MKDKPGGERHTHQEWRASLEQLDLEIVRLATICQVRILEPGVLARVLDNDARDCGQPSAHAFESLRGLLYLHFQVQQELADAFGPADTAHIVHRVWEHLRPRIGEQLGDWPPHQ